MAAEKFWILFFHSGKPCIAITGDPRLEDRLLKWKQTFLTRGSAEHYKYTLQLLLQLKYVVCALPTKWSWGFSHVSFPCTTWIFLSGQSGRASGAVLAMGSQLWGPQFGCWGHVQWGSKVMSLSVFAKITWKISIWAFPPFWNTTWPCVRGTEGMGINWDTITASQNSSSFPAVER